VKLVLDLIGERESRVLYNLLKILDPHWSLPSNFVIGGGNDKQFSFSDFCKSLDIQSLFLILKLIFEFYSVHWTRPWKAGIFSGFYHEFIDKLFKIILNFLKYKCLNRLKK